MHHALLISEIFREICAELDAPSLPAVARSCRAFHDTALDELWRDLYNIYPFVHLLAAEEDDKWSTLCRYSVRTRSLYVCMMDDLPYFDRFPCLSSPPDPDSFFPNLRTLAWFPDNHSEILPFFKLLCGPALTFLSAEFATDPASLTTVAALGTLCPNITDISISASSPSPSDDLASALSTSIRHWKHLEQVSCDELSLPAMQHLSDATALESLTVCASGRSFSFPRPLDTQTSFPRLRHLHLYTGILSTIATCFTGLHLSLEDFRLDLFDAEHASSASCLYDALAALAAACAPSSLARFHICIVHPHFASPHALATIRDLGPLLRFSHLRVAVLEGLPSVSLDDDDISVLSAAWPHLEELALSTYVDHPTASLPTAQALVRLARACPKLRVLALVLDMTALPPVRDVRSDVLDVLCLGNSPIKSPLAVASLLRSLYPALSKVDLGVWNKEPLDRLPRRDRYELWWGFVNTHLHILDSVADVV